MDTDFPARSTGSRLLEPAVSWPAIFAGSVTALAMGTTLTVLGAGFGFTMAASAVASDSTAAHFTPELGAWMLAAQVVSLGLGGYLAGRLRHQWTGVHGDESHFRDTAHGLVVWAVCTMVGGIVAASALGPLTASVGAVAAPISVEDAERAAHLAAQSSLFLAVGFFLSAFSAAVAARIGGMQGEAMHARIAVVRP